MMGEVIPYIRDRVPPARRTKREAFAAFRARLVAEIEFMIELVDEIDGDPDIEGNGDDEPSLGWTKTMATGGTEDREEDVQPA